MKRDICFVVPVFSIVLVTLLSCDRKLCANDNFYSVYGKRFEASSFNSDFVNSDLELKRKIFSELCIPSNVKRMLLVEYRDAAQGFYSQGLLFTYEDAKTYYFKVKDRGVIAGKGSTNNSDLNKILFYMKENFANAKTILNKDYSKIHDAPIINVILYDSSKVIKFDSFNFPIVAADSLVFAK
jgi:hypothetical protein